MKQAWSKPQVDEQQVGMEVSSYLPAELDARWRRRRRAWASARRL